MKVRKQTVSFTEAAYGFAQSLVDGGEYPNVSAAVSGEMVRAKAGRDAEAALLEAEVQRRLALPLDRWEPMDFAEIARRTRERRAGSGPADDEA